MAPSPETRAAPAVLCARVRIAESGRLIDVDDDFARLVGRAPHALAGRGFDELLPPGARLYWHLMLLPRLRVEGSAEEVSLTLLDADGGERPVLAAFRCPPHGGDVDAAFMRAERRHAVEARLLQAQRAAEQLPGVPLRLVADRRGRHRVAYAARSLRELAGLDPADLLADAAPLWRAVHRQDRPAVAAALQGSRRTRKLPPVGFRLLAGDGRLLWLRAHATVRETADGETEWQGVLYDVTQQHELDQRLREVDRLHAVATLAAGIAHDFNNLLGSIRGLAELCEIDAPAGSRQSRNLGHIVGASQRAAELVRQLLDFSRESPQQREDTTLAMLLHRCRALLSAGHAPGIGVEVQVLDDAPVQVDVAQLEQCLLNLVANAAHAMRANGGVVRVLADRGVADDGAEAARLRVLDRGEGIPEPLLARIFEPFFTTKPVGEGTGLGLAAVHGIVVAHGGSVRARSQPGRGTELELLLPLHAAASPHPHPPPMETPA